MAAPDPGNPFQSTLKKVAKKGGIRRSIQAQLRLWGFGGNTRSNRAVREWLSGQSEAEDNIREAFKVETGDWAGYEEWRRDELAQAEKAKAIL
jgi:hypothetical protein